MDKNRFPRVILTAFFIGILIIPSQPRSGQTKVTVTIPGVREPVEITKDRWGISHIYAKNQADLFFAQGFNSAEDRLFQLEIWRRQATGTLAEILGRRALEKDIGARLLKARVDMKQELSHYHPQGEEIITSFIKGINAYIDLTEKNPGLLPIEFKLLGIKPGKWTPEVVISRHNGLFRNVRTEVDLSQAVRLLGPEKTKSLLNLHPGDPVLYVEEGVDLSLISDKILELYDASRFPVRFIPEDIAITSYPEERGRIGAEALLAAAEAESILQDEGSNNWVLRGKLTFTRRPIMANDPHRTLQVPSLRYWVHLTAPGWNVIGGGEPALPGVSIGHNEYGAWGLTIFSIDQEDLYVYQTNPENPNQYLYRGNWENMKVVQETIPVKGESDITVLLKFTRHGPVLYEDVMNQRAYALRAAWLEVGCAPYLASLRMNQSSTWDEFRRACTFSRAPSENMVWADVDGNIGWQAVGITPLRKNWNGLLPVPGDGRFEWQGFLPVKSLPSDANPPEGFIATANQDNIPHGYPHVLGFFWTDPFRFARIQEFLSAGRKLTMTDMMDLQQDELSIPARSLIPLLRGIEADDSRTRRAIELLLSWDFRLSKDSVEATIYTAWERHVSQKVQALCIPERAREVFRFDSLKKTIDRLIAPDGQFGADPVGGRDSLLLSSMKQAAEELSERLGPDMSKWQYGQEKFHHVRIRHMLSPALSPELRARLDVGPFPRGGNSYTVNMTTNNFNQNSGGSFRIIVDVGEWDNSVGTNTPGQSGNPDSHHYSDLFEPWARGKYFPVFFSRSKIESVAENTLIITPLKQ